MPAFYDFFRKIKFLPGSGTAGTPIPTDTVIEADSVTDTANIIAGVNIAFSVTDTVEAGGNPLITTDSVTISGPKYDVYVPSLPATPGEKATIRLERDAIGLEGIVSTDIDIVSDPTSPILINRTGSNQITIGSSSPTLPFSQEQIEDFSAYLLTNGTHTDLTVNYDDYGSFPSSLGQDATSGSGTGAVFDINVTNNIYYAVVTSPGLNFAPGDTITILGSNLPNGTSPANDITITVNTVDVGGEILTVSSVTGTPPLHANVDLAVTSTLQTVTGRGATTSTALTFTNNTSSTNSSTGALVLTAGGLGVFENINAGNSINAGSNLSAVGSVTGATLVSTVATGTSPLTVTSTTEVANLRAATASKWTTARTVTFAGGDVSGSFTIDGSADVSNVALTVQTNAVALGTDTTGNYVAVGATSGNGISGSTNSEGATFTVTSNATSSNTAETIVFRDASGNFSAGTVTASLTGNVSGNATTATTLQTARNINGVSFNGSADITVTANTTNALTIGTGLSGTSFNGSSAVTIAIDSTVVTLTGTQRLENKTLTLPIIDDTSGTNSYQIGVSELTADRIITLPLLTGNDTFVFAAHSQTLTNKTINATNNTISNLTNANLSGTAGITNANLANSSITVNGTAISLGGSGTVTAAAGTLTGTTLNATVVTSSLTSVGTLTNLTVTNTISGSINGNAATVTNGVYTTGNQTIGGNKSFTGNTTLGQSTSNSLSINVATGTPTVTASPAGYMQITVNGQTRYVPYYL
jgi:hypothetical protein